MNELLSIETPLAYALEGSALVTSLPYADGDLSEADYKAARKLVAKAILSQKESHLDLDDIEIIETPAIDRLSLVEEHTLGKRKADDYNDTAISVENLKRRVIQLAVIKKHINEILNIRQATNSRLRDSLQKELSALSEKCKATNEHRKFAQVPIS